MARIFTETVVWPLMNRPLEFSARLQRPSKTAGAVDYFSRATRSTGDRKPIDKSPSQKEPLRP